MKRNRKTYDRLCNIADKLLARYNPCAECDGCGFLFSKKWDCCKGCPFLGPRGCTTSCLGCKLWLCDPAWRRDARKDTLLGHQLDRLVRIADKLNMRYARSTPEEALAMKKRESVWFLYYEHKRGAYS